MSPAGHSTAVVSTVDSWTLVCDNPVTELTGNFVNVYELFWLMIRSGFELCVCVFTSIQTDGTECSS